MTQPSLSLTLDQALRDYNVPNVVSDVLVSQEQAALIRIRNAVKDLQSIAQARSYLEEQIRNYGLAQQVQVQMYLAELNAKVAAAQAKADQLKQEVDMYIENPNLAIHLRNEVNKYISDFEIARSKVENDLKFAELKLKELGDKLEINIKEITSCRYAGSQQDIRNADKQYFCKEIPIGKTNQGVAGSYEWQQKKELIRSQSSGKISYDVSVITNRFGLNIKNNGSEFKNLAYYQSYCVSAPQIDVYPMSSNISYQVFKYWWGSWTVRGNISTSGGSITNLNTCALFKASLQNSKPKVEILSLQAPKMDSLVLHPIRISMSGFLFDVLNFVTFDLVDKMISKYANNMVQGYADNIKDGSFIKPMMEKALADKLAVSVVDDVWASTLTAQEIAKPLAIRISYSGGGGRFYNQYQVMLE
jgi:hypothetical protein